jgi:hypothetical protein
MSSHTSSSTFYAHPQTTSCYHHRYVPQEKRKQDREVEEHVVTPLSQSL